MRSDPAKISRLLKTARGQIDGILKMVEEDRYCIDISHQLLATQAILKRANRNLLTDHIHHCVKESIESQDEGDIQTKLAEIEKILDELLK
ncbi:MAG: metal-sensing transcriptional repressor [Tissierellia bacterium]|nr:metal-sensing transcriptional repressor [Tissierellia bacterium]